jgi:hypothetical protein
MTFVGGLDPRGFQLPHRPPGHAAPFRIEGRQEGYSRWITRIDVVWMDSRYELALLARFPPHSVELPAYRKSNLPFVATAGCRRKPWSKVNETRPI